MEAQPNVSTEATQKLPKQEGTGIQWGDQTLPSLDDIESPAETTNRLRIRGALETQELYKTKPDLNTSIWEGTTLSYQLYDWHQAPKGVVDENYTDDLWEKNTKDAIDNGLAPFMVSTLTGAQSEQHFQQLLENAKKKQEFLKVISENSEEDFVGTMAGVMIRNMIDPAALAVGGVAGGIAGAGAGAVINGFRGLYQGYRAARVARLAQIASIGTAGAVGSAAPEYLNQQLNQIPVTNMDIIFAATAGTAFAGGIAGLGVATRGFRNAEIFSQMGDRAKRTLGQLGVRVPGVPKKTFEGWVKEGQVEAAAAQQVDEILEPLPGAYDAVPETTIPSAAEPTTTVPHPRHPEVQLPADETGHVILYRGDTENAGVRENKRFINYATTLEEAQTNGGDVTVIRVPPNDIGKLRARAPEGKVDPNETNFAVPRDIHEAHSKPYLPKPVDAEFTPPPATAPEPEAPASQGLDIAEMSLKDVGDAVGVDLPDVKVALRTGGDDVAPSTNPATYTESIPTGREAKIPGALTTYKTPIGSFVVATADPDGSPRGPYNVWDVSGTKFAKMTKTPLQSMDEVQAFAMKEAAARTSTETIKAPKKLDTPDIEGEGTPKQAPIVKFRKMAAEIEKGLPPVKSGYTRLWRGNRPGEVGQNPQFTNDLPGIALPFKEAYKGPLSYVDVPTSRLKDFVNKGAAAEGAEFILPSELAALARAIEEPEAPTGLRVNAQDNLGPDIEGEGYSTMFHGRMDEPSHSESLTGAISVSPYRALAENFGNVREVRVKNANYWDFRNPDHVKRAVAKLGDDSREGLETGDYFILEGQEFQDFLDEAGFKGYWFKEDLGDEDLGLAVKSRGLLFDRETGEDLFRPSRDEAADTLAPDLAALGTQVAAGAALGAPLGPAGAKMGALAFGGLGLVDFMAKGSGARLVAALADLDMPDLKLLAKDLGLTTSGKNKAQLIDDMAKVADEVEKNPSSAGAAAVFARQEELITDPEFRAMFAQGDKVPKSDHPLQNVPILKNLHRIDLTGILGRSRNPLTRLLAHHLGNEVVGLEGGATTPTGGYQMATQQYRQWMTEAWQSIAPAYKKYLDDIGVGNNLWNRNTASGAYQSFQEEVYEYVRGFYPTRQYSEGVQQAGEAIRRALADILKVAKNPGEYIGEIYASLPGLENVETNFQYMWRKHDEMRWREAYERLGENRLIQLFVKGFRQAQPDLSLEQASVLARRYVKSTMQRSLGRADEWTMEFGRNNYTRLRQILVDEGIEPEMAEGILDRIIPQRTEPGQSPNRKRRALIDETAWILDEEGNPFAIHQLLDKNALDIFNIQARRMAGEVALARVRIPNPAGGGNLVEGIYSDADFDKLLRLTRDWHIQNNTPETLAVRTGGDVDYKTGPLGRREKESLKFIYDRIKGVPDERYQNKFLYEAMTEWRKFNSMRLMGQVGIAQLGEMSFPMAHLGIKAGLQKMPAMRRIIQGDKSVLTDDVFRSIENWAIGSERLHGFQYNTVDEIAEEGIFNFRYGESKPWREFKRFNQIGERAIYELSGMSFLQQQQHRFVAYSFVQNMSEKGKGLLSSAWYNSGNKRRLAQLGIDEDMAARIQNQIETHADYTDGEYMGRTINRLHMEKWDDLKAKVALEQGAFRSANKFIQTNDPTNSAWFMPHPLAKLLFQFRSFPMTAYANQFLYNLHTFDPRSFNAFLWTTTWAAVMRALQVHANSWGKSPAVAERYRERYLTPAELAKAGFERAGWASILPMVIDTGAAVLGRDAIFNARSSGQPTEVIGGFPGKSMFDEFARGMSGVSRMALGGKAISEPEARALTRMLPFQNVWGISQALDAIVSPLEDRAPYRPREIK